MGRRGRTENQYLGGETLPKVQKQPVVLFYYYYFILFLKGEKGFPGFRARVTHHMGSDLFLKSPVIACLALSWPLISLFTLFPN
jgi:hypothetical protein